ncbi:MAG: hypothetical protein HYS05_11635 [Acidobacteria bacterium]|nr:hypothetical protein [Acidobacteriota bacterium]
MAREFYCPNCGTVGRPKTVTRGSFLMEVFLWLLLIFPGLIYSLWRLTTKTKVCPKCGAPHMIPTDSPKAIEALSRKTSTDRRP